MKTTSRIWGTQESAIASVRSHGGTTYRHKTLPIVAVVGTPSARTGRVVFAVWRGNAAKPCCYYSASTLERALRSVGIAWSAIESSLKSKAERVAAKAAQRASLSAANYWTVGDVVFNSWGYDQTNIDFYQVTGVDAKSIRIRPIARKAAETSYMAGICQPDRYNFTGAEMRKPLRADGGIVFRHGGSRKWDGKAVSFSSYA